MTPSQQAEYHFGIDGVTLTEPDRGNSVAHFLGRVIEHLRPSHFKARFTCFTRESDHSIAKTIRSAPVEWNQPKGDNFAWRHIFLPFAIRRMSVDVMWFPFHIVPLFIGSPAVVTIHDISFLVLRHHYSWRARTYLRLLLYRALAQASQIITISQFTADELIRVFSISPNKITVVHHGFSQNLTVSNELVTGEVFSRLGVIRPYFLFLDGANARKNLGLLLEMVSRNSDSWLADLQFVVTGNVQGLYQRLKTSGLQKRIGDQFLLPGVLPANELDVLFRQARGLLYLSEYEGFGLPILEAFARQCPVVALRASALPEVAGNAALFINPGDVEQLTEAVKTLLDATVRNELISAGEKQGQRFSWSHAADHICETLCRVAEKKRPIY